MQIGPSEWHKGVYAVRLGGPEFIRPAGKAREAASSLPDLNTAAASLSIGLSSATHTANGLSQAVCSLHICQHLRRAGFVSVARSCGAVGCEVDPSVACIGHTEVTYAIAFEWWWFRQEGPETVVATPKLRGMESSESDIPEGAQGKGSKFSRGCSAVIWVTGTHAVDMELASQKQLRDGILAILGDTLTL